VPREGGAGCLGAECRGGEFLELEHIAVHFVGCFEHAVVDGGFEVDDVALVGFGVAEAGERFAGHGVDPGCDRQELDLDVGPGGHLDQAADLVAADGRVGDPQDRVLVDDRVQLTGVAVAEQDLLAPGAGGDMALDVGRVGDAGGAGDQLDVAGDLEQAGDERDLERADLRGAGFEPGIFTAEDVVVLAPPAALSALAGELEQRVAAGAVDAVQLAQVGDVVAVRLDPLGFLDVVELGGAPAELPLDVGGGQAAGLAQLDQPAAERALPDRGAVAGGPDLVDGSPPGRARGERSGAG
jgi:hypothetical protein